MTNHQKAYEHAARAKKVGSLIRQLEADAVRAGQDISTGCLPLLRRARDMSARDWADLAAQAGARMPSPKSRENVIVELARMNLARRQAYGLANPLATWNPERPAAEPPKERVASRRRSNGARRPAQLALFSA